MSIAQRRRSQVSAFLTFARLVCLSSLAHAAELRLFAFGTIGYARSSDENIAYLPVYRRQGHVQGRLPDRRPSCPLTMRSTQRPCRCSRRSRRYRFRLSTIGCWPIKESSKTNTRTCWVCLIVATAKLKLEWMRTSVGPTSYLVW